VSRWVRIQTDVFEHAVFAREPFTEREAWLWLISKAAWKATKHRVGKSVVDVQVGSVFLTLREMQAAWRWKSDKRVRSFLTMLENEEMIETKTDAGKTQVSICNYSRYQDAERKEDASGTHGGRMADALKTPVHHDTKSSSLRSEDTRTPRGELETVLDTERAGAVIDHRKRIGKPLTAHAAKLLADKLARCPDPNFAADEMISNGWQGFKPEWLENRASPSRQSTDPPRKPRNAGELSYQQLMGQTDEHTSENDKRLGSGDRDAETPNLGSFQKFAISGELLRRM
jgi:hypothetical protein